ncbi:sensor histidine kinase [Microcoleus sp. LEGE 07076]|uniref:sensor histidine kinase n=1 Tax=Microcoleus sp. LEGE 07076 TaxID=915322 RepID=UPI001D15022E|nr:ATP-binding protein [Microcoleus sp. LEGE 07076]
MLLSIFKTQKILDLLKKETGYLAWKNLRFLMCVFLVGYCFALFLLVNQQWQLLPILIGLVFGLGSLFVLLSVNIYHYTFQQLLATRVSQEVYRQAQIETETTLIELQRTQAKLIQSEKMSSLGQIVAGIAHEINNPVGFIDGNLRYIEQYTQIILHLIQLYHKYLPHPPTEIQTELDAIDLDFIKQDITKILHSMNVGTTRIKNIVSSLRNFSGLDRAELKEVDIHEGIDSTLLILNHRLNATSIRPQISIVKEYESLSKVECNAAELNQAVMNIIANAIDAIDEKIFQQNTDGFETILGQITVRTSIVNQFVQIAIADNGCGIPQSIQGQIFNPFFTTKDIGQGTGMGLSISYHIICEKHRGQLNFSSTPGKLTEFTIQIPIKYGQGVPL